MQILNAEQLKNTYSENLIKYSALSVFSNAALKRHQEELSSSLAFSATALSLLKCYEEKIRVDLKDKSLKENRAQVLRHRIADLWGLVVTLDRNLIQTVDSLNKNLPALEAAAVVESLYRNCIDAIYSLQRFNNEEYLDTELMNSFNYLYSLLKPSDIRGLSNLAVEFLNQIA